MYKKSPVRYASRSPVQTCAQPTDPVVACPAVTLMSELDVLAAQSGQGQVQDQVRQVMTELVSVLGDLRTVVNDIKTLVTQIDVVTHKIDQSVCPSTTEGNHMEEEEAPRKRPVDPRRSLTRDPEEACGTSMNTSSSTVEMDSRDTTCVSLGPGQMRRDIAQRKPSAAFTEIMSTSQTDSGIADANANFSTPSLKADPDRAKRGSSVNSSRIRVSSGSFTDSTSMASASPRPGDKIRRDSDMDSTSQSRLDNGQILTPSVTPKHDYVNLDGVVTTSMLDRNCNPRCRDYVYYTINVPQIALNPSTKSHSQPLGLSSKRPKKAEPLHSPCESALKHAKKYSDIMSWAERIPCSFSSGSTVSGHGGGGGGSRMQASLEYSGFYEREMEDSLELEITESLDILDQNSRVHWTAASEDEEDSDSYIDWGRHQLDLARKQAEVMAWTQTAWPLQPSHSLDLSLGYSDEATDDDPDTDGLASSSKLVVNKVH